MSRLSEHGVRSKPAQATRMPVRAGLALSAIAISAASAVLLFVANIGGIATTLSELLQHHRELDLAATLLLVLAGAIPLVITATLYFVLGQCLRVLSLATYLVRFHRYCSRYLRPHSPPWHRRLAPRGLPFTRDGIAQPEAERPLTHIFRHHSCLLLGESGSGKTTALHHHAAQRSRLRWLIPIALGHAPLPILVSLPAYADASAESGGPRWQYLVSQVRAFGDQLLTDRVLRSLGRWRMVVLCDDLDLIPMDEGLRVADELTHFNQAPHGRIQVVVACELSAYLHHVHELAPLSAFTRVVVEACEEVAARARVRLAQRDRAVSRRQPIEDPRRWHLGTYFTQPATLDAVLDLLRARRPVPIGRLRVTIAHARLLCEDQQGRAAGDASTAVASQSMLGWLALAMHYHRVTRIPVPPDQDAGIALRDWILDHPVPHITPGTPLHAFEMTSEQTELAVGNAIRSRILTWEPDRLGIHFTQHRLAATFVGLGLHEANPSSEHAALQLPMPYLDPRWSEPLLVWTTLGEGANALAAQLLTLARTQQHNQSARQDFPTLTRPARKSSPTVPPHVHAQVLALAIALQTLTNSSNNLSAASPSASLPTLAQASARDQDTLRTVFEHIQALIHDTGREHLTRALAALEHHIAVDISEQLACVAREPTFGRLIRAQAIGLLGLIPSATSADTLIAGLAEADPVVRQAIDTAIAHAQPDVLVRLKQALGDEDERTRSRAQHALALAGDRAITIALQDLRAPNGAQRAAAARLLGELSADVASADLRGCLDDADLSVRIAATWALGQSGDPEVAAFLETRLTAAEPAMRVAIVRALGILRQSGSAPVLVSVLREDPEPSVRAASAEALGKLGDDRGIQPLLDGLADVDPIARAAAASALRRLGHHFGGEHSGNRAAVGRLEPDAWSLS